jgi:hypothetical protein
MLKVHEVKLPKTELVALLSSTNVTIALTAFTQLRQAQPSVVEIEPVLTHAQPLVRLEGVNWLSHHGEKAGVERTVRMLRDPEPLIRWQARQILRRQFQTSLGADSAAYEKWWAKNKSSFKPREQTEDLDQDRFRPVPNLPGSRLRRSKP